MITDYGRGFFTTLGRVGSDERFFMITTVFGSAESATFFAFTASLVEARAGEVDTDRASFVARVVVRASDVGSLSRALLFSSVLSVASTLSFAFSTVGF